MKHLIYFLLLTPLILTSQVTNEGKPQSWKHTGIETQPIILPGFDLKAIQKEDEINDIKGEGPWRFGYDFSVNINIDTNGTWTNLSNGSRFWLVNIKSNGALTMNFIFDEFYIPEGGKLYFYNADKSDLLGAYTHTQNREDKLFGSWLVDGDDIFIEYYEPADKIGKGRLNISKAIHGYRSVIKSFEAKALNDSGPCNLDVDCSIGADFDDFKDQVKKSVGLVLVGGSGWCSGALVNNTSNDGTPYFLTADHCLNGNVGSWAFRFDWRSPNPVCATGANSSNGSFNQTVSGATLKANNSGSDVALLEITAPLPSSWDLVWAGWDRTSTPANYTVGIHHPSGDIMKVCRDDDSPYTSSEAGAEVWFIDEWETGVTEPGSSGSPLFNQDGRIVGQLYGGAAACAGTSNNGAYDYYGRFDVSWNSGNSPNSRLKEWLDPNNTGETTLDQYPPQQVFNNDARINITDVPANVCGNSIQPNISIENNGLDILTSATLTYQLNSEALQSISWTGSLLTGESEIIASPLLNLSDGTNQLQTTISNPNGIPDQFASNNSITRSVDKVISYDSNQLELELVTDSYGSETTWTFEDENGVILNQGGPYTDNTTINEIIPVTDNACYTFTIYDEFGDGICCAFGTGSYELSTDSGEIIVQGGDFGSSETTNIGINTNLRIDNFDISSVTIYPNPTSDILYIESHHKNISSKVYDVNGKLIISTNKKEINLSAIAKGTYILLINNNNYNQTYSRKIIKD